MIRITLYRECLLNDGYKNEFSHNKNYGQTKSPFDNYLESLQSLTYTIDNVYQDDMTSLNFKLKNNDYTDIYLFNYMKIESIENEQVILTRYAFIDNIKIGNELAKVSYKIDIWNSYIKQAKGINISYLKGLRILDGTGNIKIPSYYNLPIEYGGNNKLILPSETYDENDNCCLIVQLQIYDTESQPLAQGFEAKNKEKTFKK